MIKKRRVYLITNLAVLILYIISLSVCYNNEKNVIKNYFYSDMGQIEISLYDFNNSNTVLSPDSYVNEYLVRSQYPYRVVLYDNNYNEVARTGACISFTKDFHEFYCYIDNYLTEDIIDRINDNENSGNYQATFSYACEKDKMIPVALEYKNSKLEIVDKIVFTDKTPEYTLNYPYDYFEIRGVPLASYELEDYKYIDEQIAGESAIEKYNFQETEGDYIENEYYAWEEVCFLEEDSEDVDDFHIYHAMLAGKISADTFTSNSENLMHDTVILTVIYAAAGIVLSVIEYLISRKNQINSAKYAFTNAAAHELKTPLAVIENQCEFILEGVNEDKTKEYVHSIYKESLRMNSLLSNLLRYNKLVDLNTVKKEKTNLSEICKNELVKYSSLADGKDISLNLSIIDNAFVNCNEELLSLVVDNFLSNAIKFSSVNSSVELKLTEEKKKFRLSVSNSFDGEIDNKIWDLLYTKDSSRNDKSTGMGLPISKEILKLHGYKYGFNKDNGVVKFYFIAK